MLVQHTVHANAMTGDHGVTRFVRGVCDAFAFFRVGCRLAADARNGRMIGADEAVFLNTASNAR